MRTLPFFFLLSACIESSVSKLPEDNSGDDSGVAPGLRVTPRDLDFGTVDYGVPVSATVTVENVGSGPLTLDPPIVEGASFTVIDALPGRLPVGGSANLTVVYDAAQSGSASGLLTISGDDPENPSETVTLRGATEAAPVCTPFDDFADWSIGGDGNWTATGILTENRSGLYASIAYLPDQGSAAHFALQVDTAFGGNMNDFAGLVFGVTSPDEYWVVRWDDPNNDYGRYSPSGAIDLAWCSFGSCAQLLQVTGFDLYWPADGRFVTWGIDVDGGQLRVTWNGATIVDQAVPELVGVGPGPVGLYSNDNDGGIIYDNFCVLVDP